jgi:predicted amidohydrolase
LGQVASNTQKLTEIVRQAAANGAKIVVLPEAAITGYLSQDLKTNWHIAGRPIAREFKGLDPAQYAERVPGPSTAHFSKLAKELGIYITVPFVEVDDGTDTEHPRYFNTVCLASPAGEIVAHYRKLTPWPRPEKSWATDGDRGVQAVDTEYGRVGLAICFDIHTILEKYEGEHLDAALPNRLGRRRAPGRLVLSPLARTREAVRHERRWSELERGRKAELARLRL